jgi:hypothetical protein
VNKLAKFISHIFHPLLVPTYTLAIIFNLKYFFSYLIPLKYKLLLIANVFGFTFLLPLGIIYLLLKLSYVKSYQMQMKNERAFPLLTTCLFYYLTYYLFRSISIPSLITSFFFMSALISLVTLIINFFWKISLHMIALGSLAGMLFAVSFRLNIDTSFWIIILLFCTGFAGFARLKLNAHSPMQVYSGFVTGFLLMFTFYSLI